MSRRYKGAIISATPPTTTGGDSGTAPGVWTLQSQNQAQAAGLWPSQPPPPYIEDVFSTYLYTGTDATQTITNGLNLSGKGGLVWFKDRSLGQYHRLYDTARGVQNQISSALTGNQTTSSTGLTAFNSTGFTFGSDGNINSGGVTYVSWAFREQPKFFDVVTWTGNGTAGRQIPHNLGSVPGCIMVKRYSGSNEVGGIAGYWVVYHRGLSTPESGAVFLNSTDGRNATGVWNNTAPTSTNFTVGDAYVNYSGDTYMAYVFAHDAGGFGTTLTDNVISCGTFNTDVGGAASVTLGYEPQWVMIKRTDSTGNWVMQDTMRGMSNTIGAYLYANTPGTEVATNGLIPNATGFTAIGNTTAVSATYIYIAIRRGPMKTPTDATKVFVPASYTGNSSATSGQVVTTGFSVDMGINRYNAAGYGDWDTVDKLRGLTSIGVSPNSKYLNPHNTNAEASGGYIFNATNTTVSNYGFSSPNIQGNYLFSRAPSFMDVVCYTGNNTQRTLNHNLGVAPELIIVKIRSTAGFNWEVWSIYTAVTAPYGHDTLKLNLTNAAGATGYFPTDPTSSVFTISDNNQVNSNGNTFVAYLFATCPGVSKVGSYTGTGTLTTVNCGFTGGARFVLIKRTNSTGSWYIWDTARGMVSGTDPSFQLNVTDPQSNANSVLTATTGFQLLASPAVDVNTSGGTYVFLAIA